MTAVLPGSIALGTIAGQINKGPLNNNFTSVQTAVNDLIDSLSSGSPGIGAVQSYTPTWTCSSGTAPAIGNGTITGSYIQIGKLVQLQILLTAGSTSTFGNGGHFQFTTPSAMTTNPLGRAILYDSSANKIYDGTVRSDSSTTLFIDVDWGPTGGAQAADYQHPFTFATSDTILIEIGLFV